MKLVRDNVPALHEKGELLPHRSGQKDFTFRKVTPQEYDLLLRLKLAEEVGEVLSAPDRASLIAELGDLEDVIRALEERLDVTEDEYEAQRAKRVRLGGFAEGWVLE